LNVLSLFDGISCGRLALERARIKIDTYYASEIDKYAIQIAQKNYPNTIHIGDINNIDFTQFIGKIDLLIGGSPCQGFSRAGKGLNFDDPRSKLFFKFVDALNIIKPKYFLLENVKMKKEWLNIITEYLNVKPIEINSALVSAQNRTRIYWTNIPGVEQPKDKHIYLKDIVLSDVYPVVLHNIYGGFNETSVRVFEDKSPTIRTAAGGGHIPSFVKKDLIHSESAIDYMNRQVTDGRTHWDFKHHSDIKNDKSATVVANFFKGVPYNVFKDWDCIRKFHPIECERLQTLPDNYTEGVSPTQRYKMIGNGWNVDTIVQIFENIQ
jgi:DNA (cytosine-5)-methyltransferase 3A